jgi:hypothetical protein
VSFESDINDFLQQRMTDQSEVAVAWDRLSRLTRAFGVS